MTFESSSVMAAQPRPPIWKATKNGRDILLFGGPHSTTATPPWRSSAFDRAFVGAEIVFIETLNRKSLGSSWAALKMMRAPLGQRTRDLLPEPDRSKFIELAKNYGLDRSPFWSLKPKIAASYLISAYVAAQLGIRSSNSPFGVLVTMKRDGVLPGRLVELEDVLEPTRIDASPDIPSQIKYLREVLADLPSYASQSAGLQEAWVHGDLAGMRRYAEEELRPLRKLGIEDQIMAGRQAVWMKKILAASDGGARVAALMGLTHLVAPNGILPDFEKAGYSVSVVN